MAISPESLTNRLANPATGDDARRPDILGELLETSRLDTVVYRNLELEARWGAQFPETDHVYLIAVAHGEARLEVAGAQAPLWLAAGDVALLPRGGAHRVGGSGAQVFHALTSDDCGRGVPSKPLKLGCEDATTKLVVVAFRFRATHRVLSIQRLSRSIHLVAGDPALPPELALTVQLLLKESTSDSPGASVVVSRIADILLVGAIRAHISRTDCPPHGLRALSDPQIGHALGLIHDRPGESWTVARLAAAVNLSRSAFAARFTGLVGTPPADYLARWRMTKAAGFLRDADLAMSDVAARSGYRSEASFNRAFKRVVGVTPGSYRRAVRRARSTAADQAA